MIKRLVKVLAEAQANAPFYVMPQFKNKSVVFEMTGPNMMDVAHSKLITPDEAEDLCEQLNNEWIVKKLLEVYEPNSSLVEIGSGDYAQTIKTRTRERKGRIVSNS